MRRITPLFLVAAVAGCSDDPVDVTGDFSINVANRDNGCELENWTEDGTAANIPVTISQDGGSASADVGGLTGGALDIWLGGHIFTGTVDGNDLHLELTGTRSMSMGNCAYTFDAIIDATLSNDTLDGEIRYEAQTNDQPDCGTLTNCSSVQELNGARPPT